MKKVFIYRTESCSRRKLDAKKFSDYFIKNGYNVVDSPVKADLIIFVTCAYIDDLAEESLRKVKEFKKYDAELIVAGCLPIIEKENLAEIFDGTVIPTKDIDVIDDFFKQNNIKFGDVNDSNTLWINFSKNKFLGFLKNLFKKSKFLFNSYNAFTGFITKRIFGVSSINYGYWLKYSGRTQYLRIAWGCPGNCSYCAVKAAIGDLRSKPIDQCIDEFKIGLKNGKNYFILAADDVGSYGLDDKKTFIDLLSKITENKGNFEIEIESINPRWVVKYIDDLESIVKKGKIKRICSSIQSGSNRILKMMNRYSDIDQIKNAYLKLKNANDEVIFGTEYILGFPSETDEEFKQTLDFLKEINFNWIIIHPYSDRSGTKAENFSPKIPNDVINKRIMFLKNYLKDIGYVVKDSKVSNSVIAYRRD